MAAKRKMSLTILAFGDSLNTTGNIGGEKNEALDKPHTTRLSKLLSEKHSNSKFKVDNKGTVEPPLTDTSRKQTPNCGPGSFSTKTLHF